MSKYKLRKDRVALLIVKLLVIIAVIFGLYNFIEQRISLNSLEIRFEMNQIELNENDKYELKAICSNDRFNDDVILESNNNDIVEISKDGQIKANKHGKVEIIAYVKGSDAIAKCEVNVIKKIGLEKMTLSPEINRELFLGSEINLDVKLHPDNTTQRKLIYSVSDDKVIEIDKSGVLKAKALGKSRFFVMEESSGKKLDIEIAVVEKKKYIKKISFKFGSTLTLDDGGTFQLNPIYSPQEVDDKKLIYTSSNRDIVEVSQDGLITVKKIGKASILCTNEYSKYSMKFNVLVKNTNGFITKELLDASGAMNASKVMIVAHPDDETIWGGGHLLEGNWFVVCLTNGNNSVRSREFSNALSISNSKHVILSYPDLRSRKVKDNWEFVDEGVINDIKKVISYKNWDQIVTHNPDGEYGHIHHKKTNEFTTKSTKQLGVFNKLYYFGKYYPLGRVPSTLSRSVTGNTYTNKIAMINAFGTQKPAIMSYWQQMLPYEHWVKATSW